MNKLIEGKYYEHGNETIKILKFIKHFHSSPFSSEEYLVDYIKLTTKEKRFSTSVKYSTLSFLNYKETTEEIFNKRLSVVLKANPITTTLVI
jgi:enoyl-[acyl-carrier-protein] reductase (NADH)